MLHPSFFCFLIIAVVCFILGRIGALVLGRALGIGSFVLRIAAVVACVLRIGCVAGSIHAVIAHDHCLLY